MSALDGRGGGNRPQDYRRNCTRERLGLLCLLIFLAAYALVVAEDRLGPNFRKSVPMIIAAGAIWMLCSVSYGCVQTLNPDHVKRARSMIESAGGLSRIAQYWCPLYWMAVASSSASLRQKTLVLYPIFDVCTICATYACMVCHIPTTLNTDQTPLNYLGGQSCVTQLCTSQTGIP